MKNQKEIVTAILILAILAIGVFIVAKVYPKEVSAIENNESAKNASELLQSKHQDSQEEQDLATDSPWGTLSGKATLTWTFKENEQSYKTLFQFERPAKGYVKTLDENGNNNGGTWILNNGEVWLMPDGEETYQVLSQPPFLTDYVENRYKGYESYEALGLDGLDFDPVGKTIESPIGQFLFPTAILRMMEDAQATKVGDETILNIPVEVFAFEVDNGKIQYRIWINQAIQLIMKAEVSHQDAPSLLYELTSLEIDGEMDNSLYEPSEGSN